MTTNLNFTCFEEFDAEFSVVTEALNFEDAKGFCVDENATLSRIASLEEFSTVLGFVQSLLGPEPNELWIGVETSGNEDDPLTYSFVDQAEDNGFMGVADVFPWKNNRPQGGGGKDCVRLNTGFREDNLWTNENCDNQELFICRRACAIVIAEDDSSAVQTSDVTVGSLIGLALVAVVLLSLVLGVETRKVKRMEQDMKILLSRTSQDPEL